MNAAAFPPSCDIAGAEPGRPSAQGRGVLPLPHVDRGAPVYVVRPLGEKIQVCYGVYGVAGPRGSTDLDRMAMRSVPYHDTNHAPRGGTPRPGAVPERSRGGELDAGDGGMGGDFR